VDKEKVPIWEFESNAGSHKVSFRFRIGPLTFGRTGVRLSLWGRGIGVSIPLSGKGRSFGKVRVGPIAKYFSGKRPTEAWRDDPATVQQKDFANDLGIKYPRNVAKGELSDMISKATGKKPN
jgi:hypothetical protein